MSPHLPRPTTPGVHWPALCAPRAERLLALQFQLEQSQWWAPERLREHQRAQLGPLLAHAWNTTRHYRRAFDRIGYAPDGSAPTDEQLAALPVLTRARLQRARRKLRSHPLPDGHGPTREVMTSGSTGQPVRIQQTEVVSVLWLALTLREHL